jgi:hypothetical protein
MTMQVVGQEDLQLAAGLGAWFDSVGLGIPGPYGAVPSGNNRPSPDTNNNQYEITGTQVKLHTSPGTGTPLVGSGYFNNKYGQNNNLVVDPADQVSMLGDVGNADGYSWAKVNVTSGELSGQQGWVAMAFMAPLGWTKAHGGTGPIAGGGGGGGITPVKDTTESITETDYTPYILGGAAVLGLGIIGWAVLAKPKKGAPGKRRHRRSHRRLAHA